MDYIIEYVVNRYYLITRQINYSISAVINMTLTGQYINGLAAPNLILSIRIRESMTITVVCALLKLSYVLHFLV